MTTIDKTNLINNSTFNPGCIVKHEDETFDYYIKNETTDKIIMVYRSADAEYALPSLVYCEMDTSYNVDKESTIILSNPIEHKEDPRLFIHNNKLHVSYGVYIAPGPTKVLYSPLVFEKNLHDIHLLINSVRDNRRTEKNWTFFEKDNELLILYNITPLQIYNVNKESFLNLPEQHIRLPYMLNGGAPPVLVDNTYYIFCHTRFNYETVCILVDMNFKILNFSKKHLFKKEHRIEFISSALYNPNTEQFVLLGGFADKDIRYYTISKNNIFN